MLEKLSDWAKPWATWINAKGGACYIATLPFVDKFKNWYLISSHNKTPLCILCYGKSQGFPLVS